MIEENGDEFAKSFCVFYKYGKGSDKVIDNKGVEKEKEMRKQIRSE